MIAVHAYERFQWSSQIRPADHRSHPRAPTTGNRSILYTPDRDSKPMGYPTSSVGVLRAVVGIRLSLRLMLAERVVMVWGRGRDMVGIWRCMRW